ncbi:major facilitator superfamily domain-containing protein [Xylaria bambusicola]|uniref:major facilitator superfamily domain-containing protein n=1 Tax=Xylaria bambusicola TaxID=326684 RepID=UPI002008AC39|nr:major facilitator superfamily domain-containing protein [Xylaria bambusicola]KAI0503301.1 major facilitator superfamily domain-containing protein [Xylaria bambusicola]
MSKPERAVVAAIDEKPALAVTSESDDASTGPANNASPSPSPSPGDHDAGPPNGGLVAWLQVAAAFVLYGNTLGLLNTFGVYQTYYETHLLKEYSGSNISWIGSIQSLFLMAVGVFVGPLYDAGHCRTLLITGTIFVALGFMLTSISTAYWSIFLAQGVLTGLGTSFLVIPSIAIVPPYFKPARRPLVMGIATLGSGLAGVIYPIVFQSLQPAVGFPWAVRVQGFISLALCLFAVIVARPRYAKNTKKRAFRTLFKGASLGDSYFILYVISIVFNNLGFFLPSFYLQTYAELHGGAGLAVTKYLLAILNASSIFGRLVPSALSKWLGVINAFIITVSLSSISIFYWISASNIAGSISVAVLYGFFSGGVVAFAPVVLTLLTEDLSYLGTRLGVLNIFKGIASVIGSPIGGAIIQRSGDYLGMQLFSAFSVLLTAVFAGVIQLMLSREKKQAT